MKKFSLIVVLLFAYFVCISDVFADAYCSTIVDGDTYSYGCTMRTDPNVSYDTGPFTRNHVVYHGYGPNGYSEYSEIYSNTYYNGQNIYNYNLFGYYPSGNLIPYTEPNGKYYNDLIFTHSDEANTDPSGNVEYYTFYSATDYVDVVVSPATSLLTGIGWSNRLDFAIHINFSSIPLQQREFIFGALQVQPTMPTQSKSYCTAQYDFGSEMIRVSCSFDYEGGEISVRIKNNQSTDTNLNSSVSSYNYSMYFDLSAYELTWTTTGNIEDLQNGNGPNGSRFDDDYDYVQRTNDNMNSFFNSFGNYETFNSISSIVVAPLRLFNNIKGNCFNTKNNCYNAGDISFQLLGKNIILHDGYRTLWGRCSNDRSVPGTCNPTRRISAIYINDNEISANSSYSLLRTFRTAWNLLFGGFIIYLLGKRCVKVAVKMFNPDVIDLEVF